MQSNCCKCLGEQQVPSVIVSLITARLLATSLIHYVCYTRQTNYTRQIIKSTINYLTRSIILIEIKLLSTAKLMFILSHPQFSICFLCTI